MSFTVWEGVFTSFQDAREQYPENTCRDIFASRRWRDSAEARTLKTRELGAGNGLSDHRDRTCLPRIASRIAKENGRVRILDFGGGAGASVSQTIAAVPAGVEVQMTIVDNAELCALGRGLFSGDERVIFSETLPQNHTDFDIVHCESSLQYIDDWRQILEKLADYKASYILVCELLAGKIPSFVSLQDYYGDFVPVRFWNVCEFVATLEELGYEMCEKTEFQLTVRGVSAPLPMHNFAEEYRLEQCCDILFSNPHTANGSKS